MKSSHSDTIDNLSVAQTLLLRACLAPDKTDREQYVRAWENTVHITDLDYSSSRLIPYFLHKNQQDGITCRHDKRLKVIYKYWWLRTQHINNQLQQVHAAFLAAGIDVVIIKGASVMQYYERAELRPMADFDLLVPRAKLQEAIGVLQAMDFIPDKLLFASLQQAPDLLLDFKHAIPWTNSKHETHIDLHWTAGARCTRLFTANLWANLVPWQGRTDARKPALPYEVFMILIHAMNWSNKDNLNWVIDIAMLNNQLDETVWKKARQLAVDEKKADLFDYACSILLQFGVFAPDPGKVGKPERFSAEPVKTGGLARWVRNFMRSTKNGIYTVNRLYPHTSPPGKYYHYMRWVKFFLIMRRIRDKIVSTPSPYCVIARFPE